LSKSTSSKGKSNKKQPKYKAAAAKAMEASSTRVETAAGSHVTTIVKENFAAAEEPSPTLASSSKSAAVDAEATSAAAAGSSSQASTPPSNWLEHGREVWDDNASPSERCVVIAYSSYSTAFECRGPWGCVRWSNIDDQYALSFVFEGNFAPRIRCFPAGTNSSSDASETNVSC